MRDRICEAVRFAVDHYEKAGVGYENNYFYPPLEKLSILNGMNMAEINPDLMIAGILFNTVEDTGVTIDLIAERFGEDVAVLVNQHLKYLYLGWGEGNRKLIEDMQGTDFGFKILMMCDTVVKQRKLKRGLFVLGDAVWEKQAVSKASLSTYFSKIQVKKNG